MSTTEDPTQPRDESTQNTIVFVNDNADAEENSPIIISPFEELNKQEITNGEDNNNNDILVSTNSCDIESPLQTDFFIKQNIFADTQQDSEKFRYNNAVYLGEIGRKKIQ